VADYPILARQAKVSPDGLYRYFLYVQMTTGKRMLGWLGHNPSVADAERDDPTSRRIWDYTWRWGYDHAFIINPWAGISTEPHNMWLMDDPVGPENIRVITTIATMIRDSGGAIVLAYGVLPKFAMPHVDSVRQLLHETGVKLLYLSLTHAGFPRHPLYMEAECEPKEWREPAFPPFSPSRPAPAWPSGSPTAAPVRRGVSLEPRPMRTIAAVAMPAEPQPAPPDDGLPKRRVRA
jgi:hypothetical protein